MLRPSWLGRLSTDKLLSFPTVRPSPLSTKLKDGRVRCGVCERHCQLPEGSMGFCGTRMNIQGTLYTLVYGDISSISVNPIEKKPFFHFYPGSLALTIGTWGCNFTCPWCQNFEISKYPPDPANARYISPERFVSIASDESCKSISISFNEPTMLFEYSLDAFPMAHKRGIAANYVSNGYMSVEALKMLRDAGMDAIKFDIKGGEKAVRRYCAVKPELVWRNVKLAKELGLHVEVVNLIIPRVNDDEESIKEVVKNHIKCAGVDSPIHFTRFYPTYKMTDRPHTPLESLERAYQIAKKEGVHYPYLGNVPGHRWENTYCHSCGDLLIKRYGFDVVRYKIVNKKCPSCGQEIPIVGEFVS